MREWTAIVLAGERPGENDFAATYGVPAKALIPVGGEPMLSRVARTLLASPSIGRIIVLAQQPEALFVGGAAWLANEPRIGTAVAGQGISASVAQVAGSAAAPWPVLVTTADHPLLRPEMVETFIKESEGADSAFAMVERKVVEQAYPLTTRTWITLSDGHYSGANLFALRTPASLSGVLFWSRAEQYRKKVWRLLWFFGPYMFIRAITRTLSLDQASARAGRKLRLGLCAVLLPYAEASIDVDKPADLELAERILAERDALELA
jgi:GTP:adenosylcobinamide-phosphate guanylyltransferase